MDTVPQNYSWGGKSTQQILSFPPSSTHHVLTWRTWKEQSPLLFKYTSETITGITQHVTFQTCNPAAMCGSKAMCGCPLQERPHPTSSRLQVAARRGTNSTSRQLRLQLPLTYLSPQRGVTPVNNRLQCVKGSILPECRWLQFTWTMWDCKR